MSTSASVQHSDLLAQVVLSPFTILLWQELYQHFAHTAAREAPGLEQARPGEEGTLVIYVPEWELSLTVPPDEWAWMQ